MLAPRVVNALEDELRRQIQVLIDAFIDRGECEVNADIGRLYPTQVILTLFGLPLEDRDRLIEWVNIIVGTSDQAMIDPLIEEILRLELPAPLTPRVVQEEVTVEGVTIPSGSIAFICLATANREDGDTPDEIDPGRRGQGHLSFGGGIHRCLGSHLARRELRLVVEEFHKRIPEYRIETGVQPMAAWPSGTLHLESVPVVFGPAAVCDGPPVSAPL